MDNGIFGNFFNMTGAEKLNSKFYQTFKTGNRDGFKTGFQLG